MDYKEVFLERIRVPKRTRRNQPLSEDADNSYQIERVLAGLTTGATGTILKNLRSITVIDSATMSMLNKVFEQSENLEILYTALSLMCKRKIESINTVKLASIYTAKPQTFIEPFLKIAGDIHWMEAPELVLNTLDELRETSPISRFILRTSEEHPEDLNKCFDLLFCIEHNECFFESIFNFSKFDFPSASRICSSPLFEAVCSTLSKSTTHKLGTITMCMMTSFMNRTRMHMIDFNQLMSFFYSDDEEIIPAACYAYTTYHIESKTDFTEADIMRLLELSTNGSFSTKLAASLSLASIVRNTTEDNIAFLIDNGIIDIFTDMLDCSEARKGIQAALTAIDIVFTA